VRRRRNINDKRGARDERGDQREATDDRQTDMVFVARGGGRRSINEWRQMGHVYERRALFQNVCRCVSRHRRRAVMATRGIGDNSVMNGAWRIVNGVARKIMLARYSSLGANVGAQQARIAARRNQRAAKWYDKMMASSACRRRVNIAVNIGSWATTRRARRRQCRSAASRRDGAWAPGMLRLVADKE